MRFVRELTCIYCRVNANLETRTDTAKRILGKTASWRENKVLGSAKFANDITVTHSDADYMRRHYEMVYNEEQAVSTLGGVDMTKRLEMAKKEFKPMYLIKMYQEDLTKLEMSFNGRFTPDKTFGYMH